MPNKKIGKNTSDENETDPHGIREEEELSQQETSDSDENETDPHGIREEDEELAQRETSDDEK